MSKKIKILSALACGVLLSSSLSFTNVQAATIKNNSVSTKITNRAVINDEIYSTYCILSNEARQDIFHYIKKNEGTPTITGLRDMLVRKGHLSKKVANNIAYSLFSLGTECTNVCFPERYSDTLAVIESNKHEGEYTVVGHIKKDTNCKYDVFAVLTPEDSKCIHEYLDSTGGNVDRAELTEYILNNSVTSDSYAASSIAKAIYNCDFEDLDIDTSVLVLRNMEYNDFFIARLPR